MRLEVDSTWDGHPARPDECVNLTLSSTLAGLRVEVDAPFHGDPPPPGEPGPCWELWEHEVVELFVVERGTERYTEIELGPHGHFLVLQLDGVRHPVATQLPIAYATHVSGDRWMGQARIPWSLLPPGPHAVNAYAIHGVGRARRYLAAFPVPGPSPDFHRIWMFPELVLPRTPPR